MFKKITHAFLKRLGYRLVASGTILVTMRELRRFRVLSDLYARVTTVEGAVVECGVGKGRSFLYFAFLVHQGNRERTLWGFDSFEGFPEPSKEDLSTRAPKKGEWKGTSEGDIINVLRAAGVPTEFIASSIKIVPGFFENSLAQYDGALIAFLHVDADLYQSYKEVLNTLVPHVAQGGVVLFDEYGEGAWVGATKAVDEFLSGTSWTLERHDESGKYYFIKS